MEHGQGYRDSFMSCWSQEKNKKRQFPQRHTLQILVCKFAEEIGDEAVSKRGLGLLPSTVADDLSVQLV